MAQAMEARVNVLLYDPSGSTIATAVLYKAYKNGAGTWGIVGDTGSDDPGGANAGISMTRGLVSSIDSNYYNWYADIDESYTYTLYINGSPIADFTGRMLFSMDLMQYIESNYTHASGDGSDHANVALNDAHRATITGNPHSVTKSNVGLGSAENKSSSTILDELTTTQILASGIDTDDFTDATGLFITESEVVTKLADGSTDSNKVITSMAGLINGNARMAAQIAANISVVQTGTLAATAVTPDFVGQLYIKTDTNNVYIAETLVPASGWITLV